MQGKKNEDCGCETCNCEKILEHGNTKKRKS